ncbi:aspartyl-phosphate phosphatase Spo0E family protein [Paenibacillus sp. JNUCC31]|uniref:aspartyl-phosphate phosphatase Spo0E family protein n=1 Tax=Paenibacillus sp. JNUCC-31 TaxID=2777983 RepID=UPI00177EEA4C|nr:aspartyl-phosphate phosphatase Spo0E family protein [Paenibacillus sp. JNUCC-31]QOS76487.1 aspartyl-phosphate phosphatase Spo0E family protein [Paenibacillus sp. JNUCC-31]
MIELEQIRDQIEQNRQDMRRLVEKYGINDDKVLQQSMMLDELINKYIRLKTNGIESHK